MEISRVVVELQPAESVQPHLITLAKLACRE
jgi:hypothetical protein